jgi:solute carrier family 6 (neurotransmitter transporter, GABA) member 1
VTVAPPGSKNWRIPVFWAPVLRYISGPILLIVLSFAYPVFSAVRNDPLHVFGFTCAHLAVFFTLWIYIWPRSLDVFVPAKRREEGVRAYAPQVLCGLDDIRVTDGVEAGIDDSQSSDAEVKTEDKDAAKVF